MQKSIRPRVPRAAAHRLTAFSVVLSAALLLQCKKQPKPEGHAAEPAQSGTKAAPNASAVANAPLPSNDPVRDAKPETDAPPPVLPNRIAALGDWIEASLYKFKASAIRRCPGTNAAKDQATKSSSAGGFRVGVTVAITAKVDPVLSSPRDITIEHEGVILEAELTPNLSCGALLATKQLRGGETSQGVVVFTLPDAAFAKGGLRLNFKPTRWGGAPKVSVDIPECLDACPGGSAGRAAH